MQITVTTPTGHVGSRVAQLLVQAGVRPVLLVRDPAKLDPALRELADVRQGDLTDPAAVEAATAGSDAAFWLDGVAESADDPVAASTRLGETIAAAVTANGITRNVFVSSVGAELRHGMGNIDGLARIEEALDATGTAVTHLRCGYFFTNLLMSLDALRDGVLTSTREPDERMPWVDPRDVGDVAAARLLSPGWTGRHVQAVHGPADLTFDEVAGILTAATGQPVAFHHISLDVLRAGLRDAGLSATAVEGFAEMSRSRPDFTPEQPRGYVTTTPSDLHSWAYANLRSQFATGRARQHDTPTESTK
jgi:uncharacterized protein YbjT (DUF2867 family)